MYKDMVVVRYALTHRHANTREARKRMSPVAYAGAKSKQTNGNGGR